MVGSSSTCSDDQLSTGFDMISMFGNENQDDCISFVDVAEALGRENASLRNSAEELRKKSEAIGKGNKTSFGDSPRSLEADELLGKIKKIVNEAMEFTNKEAARETIDTVLLNAQNSWEKNCQREDVMKAFGVLLEQAHARLNAQRLLIEMQLKKKENSPDASESPKSYESVEEISSIPIQKEIAGVWKAIRTENRQEYLETFDLKYPENARIERLLMNSIQFLFEKEKLSCHTLVKDKYRKDFFIEQLGIWNEGTMLCLENNHLKTSYKNGRGKICTKIDRYIRNGELHIVHQNCYVTCKIVYQRIR